MKTNKIFTNKILILGLLIVAIVVGIWGYKTYFSSVSEKEISQLKVEENFEDNGSPIFTWKFDYDSTLNLDGNPRTNIFLEAKYPNGKTENKFIGTTDGSCNILPEVEIDSLISSENIQCYYAGLGYRFKITKGENSYLVQRKIFEEGSPEYNPPASQYEVVSEFPTSN